MDATDRYSRLTRVSSGTPMGGYMRYFWHPVAASAQLADDPLRVRILGENLILFRTKERGLGLVSERCPHRGASLACGMIEHGGIRCSYHGWKFSASGNCIETPAERPESQLKKRVKLSAYPVQELGGLIWAYLGNAPAPLLPRYEFLVKEGCDRDVGITILPCNWLQVAENNMDPIHVEYLHFAYTNYLRERQGKPPVPVRSHKKIDFEVFEHGIIKRRMWEGDSEDSPEWRIGHPQIWPGTVVISQPNDWVQAQIRVPIDDTNTAIYWYNARERGDGQPPQSEVPVWQNPVKDEHGNFNVDTLNGQDLMIMLTQGEISDRQLENLGESDRGVVLYRRVLLDQLDKIERGEEPLGVVRDPAKNTPYIALPIDRQLGYDFGDVKASPHDFWNMSVSEKTAAK